MFTVAIVAIALALFAGAFLSKRRFGLLGLALTAGATISVIWDDYANLLVSMLGVFPDTALTQAVTLSVLVLLPAFLLLFHGYAYKSMVPRVLGSALFALLGVTFLVVPIGHALPLEGAGLDVYNYFVNNKDLLVSVGVTCAVIDLFFTKPAKHHSPHGKK